MKSFGVNLHRYGLYDFLFRNYVQLCCNDRMLHLIALKRSDLELIKLGIFKKATIYHLHDKWNHLVWICNLYGLYHSVHRNKENILNFINLRSDLFNVLQAILIIKTRLYFVTFFPLYLKKKSQRSYGWEFTTGNFIYHVNDVILVFINIFSLITSRADHF